MRSGPGPAPVRTQGPVHLAPGPGPPTVGPVRTTSGPDTRTCGFGPVRFGSGKVQDRTLDSLVGDAVRDDGTLKDADEMEWPNSPTDLEDDRVLARSNEPANFLDEIRQAFEQNYLSSNQVNHIIFLKLYAGTHLPLN